MSLGTPQASVAATQSAPSSLRSQTINLGAGPSPLPTTVLTQSMPALLDFANTGMGITEISHRSSQFAQLVDQAVESLSQLLSIPKGYKILFMQGGGLTQFSATSLNLTAAWRSKYAERTKGKTPRAEYVLTGSWGDKAAKEAKRLGVDVNIVADGRKLSKDGKTWGGLQPTEEWTWSEQGELPPAYIYYCANETVNGVELDPFPVDAIPQAWREAGVPLVADMSSNILSREIDVSKYGVIYAGAQKNIGPAGVTIVIVREDLIVDPDTVVQFGGDRIPSMLMYKHHADNNSLYNTPPMFPIHVASLVFSHLQLLGGVKSIEAINKQKSQLVYDVLDAHSDFYIAKVTPRLRSRMNVVFVLSGGEESEKRFVEQAGKRGIKQIKGHRSVGGIRTSLYNAVTLDQVQVLVKFMNEFVRSEKAGNLPKPNGELAGTEEGAEQV